MGNGCSDQSSVDSGGKPSNHSVAGSRSNLSNHHSRSTVGGGNEEIIADTWHRIEKTCVKDRPYSDEAQLDRTVRVFVSSTFVDMHSERDVLVKQVMPTIRQYCTRHSLRLCDIDLRWGVPAGTDSVDTIDICMTELDKCLGGGAFFIGLLGGRYGWVPKRKELIDGQGREAHLVNKYKWIDGISITHMEMLHGAYRANNPNAMFMIRGDNSYKGIPEEHMARIYDKEVIDVEQMKELKSKLRHKFPHQCHNYTAPYDKFVEGRVRFSKLDGGQFAAVIVKSLTDAIAREFKLNSRLGGDIDEVTKENKLQHTFMSNERHNFVGRKDQLQDLHNLIRDGSTKNMRNASITKSEGRSMEPTTSLNGDTRPIVWLAGDAGSGKSALLAEACTSFAKQNHKHLFYHHCMASESAGDAGNLAKRLYQWLTKSGKDDKLLFNTQSHNWETACRRELEKAMEKMDSKDLCLIALDGLEKLSTSSSTLHLDWLPKQTPSHMTLVIACSDDKSDMPTAHRLAIRQPIKYSIKALSDGDMYKLTNDYMTDYGKRLDEEQTKYLLARNVSKSATWLHMAMDELRVFGNYRKVTEYINRMPGDFNKLVAMCLNRVLQEDSETLCLIGADCRAMYEDKLRVLLAHSSNYHSSNNDNKEKQSTLPPSHYVATTSTLLPFLRTMADGRIVLKYTILGQLIDAQFMNERSTTSTKVHRVLYDYYANEGSTVERAIDVAYSIPYHALRAGNRGDVIEYLRRDNRAKMLSLLQKREITKGLRCTNSMTGNRHSDHATAYACVFCAPHMRSTNTCVFCGSPNGGNSNSKEATLCSKHSLKQKVQGLFCIYCSNVVIKGQTGHPLELCKQCRTDTQHRQMCAVLDK